MSPPGAGLMPMLFLPQSHAIPTSSFCRMHSSLCLAMAKEILNLEATNPKPNMQKELCCLAVKKKVLTINLECVGVDQ